MTRSDVHGVLSIPTTTLDHHLHRNHRRRRRTVRRKEEILGPPGNRGNNTRVDTTTSNNSGVGGQTTYHVGWVRPFLDQVLGRRTDGIDSQGIIRRRMKDEAADIQDLGPLDGLVEEGGDVVAAVGLEHSTSAFTGFSVR